MNVYLAVCEQTDSLRTTQTRLSHAPDLQRRAFSHPAATAVCLYGVMAYGVAQRMREIGVRMALGAQRGDVMRQVVRRGLALTVIGLAIGLIVATMTMRSVRGLLFGVTPLDPMTFLAAFLLFACVAALASYVPARRATSIDRLVALRYE